MSPHRRNLRFLLLSGTMLFVALGVGWWWINIPPQIDVDSQEHTELPRPNAYDYFVQAADAFVEDKEGVDPLTDRRTTKDQQYSAAAREAWLQKNERAFSLLRQGLKYPSWFISVDHKQRSTFRDLVRALVVESRAYAASDDWVNSIKSALDGFHFSIMQARGGTFIAGLAGKSSEVTALRELQELVPHSGAQTAQETAWRMEEIYRGRFSYSETLEVEKKNGQRERLVQMQHRFWRVRAWIQLGYPAKAVWLIKRIDPSYRGPTLQETVLELLKYAPVLYISKRKMMHDYTNMMDIAIANGRLPYAEKRPVPVAGNPIDELVASMILKKSRWNWARVETHTALIMSMYALRAYRLQKESYPSDLDELVPHYLREVPMDPFNGNSPLRYELRNEKYFLWSIGPDGVDDGGQPFDRKETDSETEEPFRYRGYSPDDKGDVVAGINTL